MTRAGRVPARAPTPIWRRAADELRESSQRYEALKQPTGALDFVDLLLRARDLLRDDAEVRRDVPARFTHLFVDEFQDTDPLQAEISAPAPASPMPTASVGRLAAGQPRPGKLFIVGDPKQSIYRFRRADVGTYREVCELLERRGAEARDADDQLPGHAGDPAGGQRRVRAADDRRPP